MNIIDFMNNDNFSDKMGEICPYCGFENLENSKFCSSCGKSLVLNGVSSSAIDYKKLIIVSYILVILFSWGSILFNFLFNSFGFIGFIGLFLPFYLIQSKDPIVKKHGYILIAISLIGISLSLVFMFNLFG